MPCLIQNHVDRDPGPGARDAACGAATYDGHQGVDFRLMSLADADAGVRVLAAAAGVVVRVRDGERDRRLIEGEPPAPDALACGNGIVIAHADGWTTQYCHLRARSLAVAEGDTVTAGQTLGLVGTSGRTAFAHVHLTVSEGDRIVDPFDWRAAPTAPCRRLAASPLDVIRGAGLWTDTARDAFDRDATGILGVGFAADAVTPGLLERVATEAIRPSPDAGALVFFARFMNLRAGDAIRLSVTGPDGFAATQAATFDRSKATYVAFAGKKGAGGRWPAGTYAGDATLIREGRPVETRRAELALE